MATLPLLPDITGSETWQTVPKQPTEMQKAISQAVLADVLAGPVMSRITKVVTLSRPADQGFRPADQYVTMAGPQSLPVPTWTRRDRVVVSPVAPVTWAAGNDVTPKESYTTVRLTGEQLLRMSPFSDVADGTAVVRKGPAFDPVLAATLSRALRVDSALQFSASANSTTSPVHPIAGYPGTTTTTTGVQLGFDLQAAYSSILAAQRFEPTVAWVTPASYLRLRAEKTSAGTYRFEQGQPLLLDSRVMPDGSVVPVPVLPAIGFPEGQPVAIVADARAIYCVFREIQSGLLVRVDWSDHSSFDTDRFLARAAIRYDYGILAGFEGAVITISHKPS